MRPSRELAPIKSLVLVDDNELDLSLYHRLVRRCGAADSVHTFARAPDALNYLKQGGTAEAIVVDIHMPGMDGFEFLQALTGEPQVRPAVVVVLTTSLDASDRARAARFPFVRDYLHKPPTADTFWHIAELVDSI